MQNAIFTDTLQVAIVVRDLDAALRTYTEEYGIGPWLLYDFNPSTVQNMIIDDQPAEYSMRLALTTIGSVQWELIEPTDDRSIYADFLKEHGEGLHHVALGVSDYGEALAVFRGKGHKIIQGGTWHGFTYSYLSTEAKLGFIAELYDEPAEFVNPGPDSVYPPEIG